VAGRARATRCNGAQLFRHAQLRRLNSACEGAFFFVDDSGPLVAQAPPELDQLIGPRRGLAQLDEESLHGDEHARNRSTSHTAGVRTAGEETR
jgi:hypothetical protein